MKGVMILLKIACFYLFTFVIDSTRAAVISKSKIIDYEAKIKQDKFDENEDISSPTYKMADSSKYRFSFDKNLTLSTRNTLNDKLELLKKLKRNGHGNRNGKTPNVKLILDPMERLTLSAGKTSNGLYQGDMKLGKKMLSSLTGLTGRKGTIEQNLWEHGHILYKINDNLKQHADLIRSALEYYMTHTCIIFEELSPNDIPSSDYMYFNSYGNECSSDIGREYDGPHEVRIGVGCENIPIILHEVGHALGLFHEQSRSDRDQYIKVIEENINPYYTFAFNTQLDYNYGIPYDYTSIMHYMLDGFSKNGGKLMTISTVDPTKEYLIKSREEPSFRDIKLLNLLYQCNSHCSYNLKCKNEGYMDVSCQCRCRPGTSGKYCERKISPYYPENDCGGVITNRTTIRSPKVREMDSRNCIWWIKAPYGYRVSVTIIDVEMYDYYNDPGHPLHGSCAFEGLGLRPKSIHQGDIYCGKDLKKGQVYISCNNEFVVNYFTKKYQWRGFSAKIDFVKRPSNSAC